MADGLPAALLADAAVHMEPMRALIEDVHSLFAALVPAPLLLYSLALALFPFRHTAQKLGAQSKVQMQRISHLAGIYVSQAEHSGHAAAELLVHAISLFRLRPAHAEAQTVSAMRR